MAQPKLKTITARGSGASDPRDHIYAMQGLVKEAVARSGPDDVRMPDVRHEDTIKAKNVFERWAKLMIDERKLLLVLYR